MMVVESVRSCMYKEVSAKELEAVVTKAGYKWPFMLSCMRLLQSGKTVHTHSWKLNDKWGRSMRLRREVSLARLESKTGASA